MKAKDWYCHKIISYINPSDEDLVPIRFRLYDKDNKLLRERLPVTSGRRFIEKFNKKIKEYPDEIKEETKQPPPLRRGVQIWSIGN